MPSLVASVMRQRAVLSFLLDSSLGLRAPRSFGRQSEKICATESAVPPLDGLYSTGIGGAISICTSPIHYGCAAAGNSLKTWRRWARCFAKQNRPPAPLCSRRHSGARSPTVPTENSISAKKGEVKQVRKAHPSVARSVITSPAGKTATCQLLGVADRVGVSRQHLL
jgi:hypothetical protein